MNFKEQYTKEIDALSFSSCFESRLIETASGAADRKDVTVIMKKRKTIRILVAVISVILLFSLTAFAITALLSASDVASELGQTELASKFEKSDSLPAVSGDEYYTVTLLGSATSQQINSSDGISVEENRTFFVVSVERNDGIALSGAEGSPIQLSPLIEGCEPYKVNLWTLGSHASGLEKDGVLYYLFDTENLEIFADRTVYLAAYEGFIPSSDIFTLNSDGTITFNESYSGFKALFELPLDSSKADPEKAAEILSQIW